MTVKDTGRRLPVVFGSKGARITVGIHGEEGGALHEPKPGEEQKPLTVAAVGGFHEFGLGVPERSFIRAWYDESIEQNRALIVGQLRLAAAGKLTLDQALERIALKLEHDVRARIRGHIPPPLAQSTIDRKGSSTPLIDTGQLVASIRAKFEVTNG